MITSLYDYRHDSRGDVTITRLHDSATCFLQGDSASDFDEQVKCLEALQLSPKAMAGFINQLCGEYVYDTPTA